jgi:dihydrofolate reductase
MPRASKTVYSTAASLDGFIATSDHSLDWLFQFGSDPGEAFARFLDGVGAIAMGASTYEWLLRHEIDAGRPWTYTQPTWVFTHRDLPVAPGADLRFVRGDVRPVHEAVVEAARDKDRWLVGGGDLVGQFHDHGLLDEVHVSIAPVTLGAGAPLLPRAVTTPPLRLRSAEAVGDAFVALVYEVVHPSADDDGG